MSTTDDLKKRVEKLEQERQSFVRFLIQYILSPILIIAIGFYFNSELQNAKQNFQNIELELKRIEAAQKMLEELFSDVPERAFIAERLITKIISDKNLNDEIQKIVANYYNPSSLPDSLSNADIGKAEKIKEAAEKYGSDEIKKELQTLEKPEFHVVVESSKNQDSAIKRATELEEIGYRSEVHSTPKGYYAITIGSYAFDEAVKKREEAINKDIIQTDSWISQGKTWIKKIYPNNSE